MSAAASTTTTAADPAVAQVTASLQATTVADMPAPAASSSSSSSSSSNPPAPSASPSADDKAEEYDAEAGEGLIDQTNAQVVVRGVGDNVYTSAKTFEQLGLSAPLLKAIADMKFERPSKIQAEALPIILTKARPNLIGQAQAGSGKTAAFALGILSQMTDRKETQALVITPTRELANQNAAVISALAKYASIEVVAVVKGDAGGAQPSTQSSGRITAQVVVGTPGTVLGKLQQRRLDSRTIRVFVADEADDMVDEQGLGEQTLNIVRKLPPSCQILLFSATFSEQITTYAHRVAPNPVELLVKNDQLALPSIKQFFLKCKDYNDKYIKLKLLFTLLELGQSIIFVQTVAMAKQLTNSLRTDQYKVSVIHGKDMSPTDRDNAIKDFRAQKTTVLIATNVISRGLDVPKVTMVVNFEVPVNRRAKADCENYIHRINRAGRFGRKGAALSLVDTPQSQQVLQDIMNHYKSPMTELKCETDDDVENISKVIKGAIE